MRPRVPKAVTQEFARTLDADTAREARAIAQTLNQSLNHSNTETPMNKRTVRTRKAELAPATPKSEPKKSPKAKAKPKAAKKVTAKTSDRATVHAAYTAAKLKVQSKCKIGATLLYHGRNEAIDGKTVKVVAHEGRGGIVVQHKDEKYIVSPLALLRKEAK